MRCVKESEKGVLCSYFRSQPEPLASHVKRKFKGANHSKTSLHLYLDTSGAFLWMFTFQEN